ncbi:MAG UNVERIFIED_CONTAM: class I SAM-dependent methyltransferase [Rickettsiaceae bacterium]|jgi:SAM-dependent methyltransferase
MTDNNTYDELPYSDYAFEYACPEHMYTISKIFGHDAPKVENARILELGCAFGSNIIGFAERYPNSKVTGIDLSQVQIERGLEEVKNLGLKNIELKAMSIGDIGASFGKFDYIICHGVYSWVPKEIQEKILEIAEKNLSPNGLVYISYNCLPGANILNSFREMMQFHSSMFNTTKDRITQAKAFVSFVKEGLEGSKSPYYTLLQSEIDIINTVGDSYIQHEYLEKGNSEFYFSDFMKSAAEHKLQYLGDARLPSMYIGNLPQKAQAKMAEINDIVRSEQYMDFITNRRFRCTILCNQNGKINRNLN